MSQFFTIFATYYEMEFRQVNGKQEGIIHFTGDHSILRGN